MPFITTPPPREGFRTVEDWLPWLAVPVHIADERIPHGAEASRSLMQCLALVEDLLPESDGIALRQLAQTAEQMSMPMTQFISRGASSPALGFFSYVPLYSAVIPFYAERQNSSIRYLRCVLLVVASWVERARIRGTIEPTRAIARLITRILSDENGAVAVRIQQTYRPHTYGWIFDALDILVSADVVSLKAAAKLRDALPAKDPSIPQTEGEINDDSPRFVQTTTSTGSTPAWDPQDEGVVVDVFLPSLEDDDEQFVDANPHLAAFDSEQETLQHLEGPLLPDAERNLTFAEFASTVHALQDIIKDVQRSPLCRTAGLALLISAVTGRSSSVVAQALLRHIGLAATRADFLINADSWVSTIPIAFQRSPTAEHFDQVHLDLNLYWPSPVRLALAKARELFHRAIDDPVQEAARITAETSVIVDELRETVSPRVTNRRLLATLPTAVYCESGDFRLAQMISGTHLYHSTAPLHYYASTEQEFNQHYAASLRMLGVLSSNAPSIKKPSRLSGGQYAGLKKYVVVDALNRIAPDSAAPLDDDDWIGRFNQSALWVAVLFSANTAIRINSHLGQFRRDALEQLVPNIGGVASIIDKSPEHEVLHRLVVLPDLFFRHLDNYLLEIRRTLDRVSQIPLPLKSNTLKRQLEDAASGRGSLFIFLVRDEEGVVSTEPVDRSTIQRRWQPDGFPVECLRNFFGTHSQTVGFSPQDIFWQMGHALEGPQFDLDDPESPLDFVHRLAPLLTSYCTALGVPSPRASTIRSLPQLRKVSHSVIEKRIKENNTRRHRHHHNHVVKPSSDTSLEGKEAMAWAQEQVGSVYTKGCPTPTKEDIQNLVNIAMNKERSTQEQVDRIHALSAIINAHADDSKNGIRIPQLQTRVPETNIIGTPALEAYRWMSTFQRTLDGLCRQWFREPEAANDRSSNEHDKEIIAVCAAMLAIDGGIVTPSRLIDCINATDTSWVHPDREDTVLVSVPISDLSDPSKSARQLFLVDRAAALAVARLAKLSRPSMTEELLDQHIQSSVLIAQAVAAADGNAVSPKTSAISLTCLLTIVRAARGVQSNGIRHAWEAEALKSVALDIDRDACLRSPHCVTFTKDAQRKSETQGGEELLSNDTHKAKAIAKVGAYPVIREFLSLTSQQNSALAARRNLDSLHSLVNRSCGDMGQAVAEWLITEHNAPSRTRLAPGTIQTYARSVCKPLCAAWGSTALAMIDTGELTLLLEQVVAEGKTASSRADRRAAITRLLPHIEDIIGTELDPHWGATDSSTTTYAAPYIATAPEIRHLINMLHAASCHPGRDSHYIACAAQYLNINQHLGARPAEIIGLGCRDAAGDPINRLIVRKRRRRGIKTRSSARVLNVAQLPIGDALMKMRAMRDNAAIQSGAMGDPDIWRHPGDSYAIDLRQAVLGPIRSISSRYQLHPSLSDSRSIRHLVATSGLYQCLDPIYRDSPTMNTEGLMPIELPPSLMTLSRRQHLRYLSRRLGHGSTVTTLSHYCHYVPLIPPSRSTSLTGRNGTAELLTENHWENLRKKRMRHKRLLSDNGTISEKAGVSPYPYIDKKRRAIMNTDSKKDIHSSTTLPDMLTFTSVGIICSLLRQSLSHEKISWIMGMPIERVSRMAHSLQIIDSSHRIYYLRRTIRMKVDNRRRKEHTRRSRDEDSLSILHNLDQCSSRSIDEALNIIRWMEYTDIDGSLSLKGLTPSFHEPLIELIERDHDCRTSYSDRITRHVLLALRYTSGLRISIYR